ncbi:MAG: hypothetical protein FWD37_02085 [Methanomassiliicoccaceae archaeon]|nr:hypothetical protein [Methanomassiliicoccaceae archaeon]
MKAISFFGGSFKEVKNIMALRGIGKEYTFFKDSNTYFKFNPDNGTITHYSDGKPSSLELLEEIHPDIICELDEFKLLGFNETNWVGKHDFEESIIKELEKKMIKLNSKNPFSNRST